ncbi:unnamed protein product [Brugia pahangi]|uniref:Beta/gamma crystallin 'Greek key' domain-containing protein n=1 Tax=Brugia pahangi TaxID=6280 RepID=A0A0N4TSC9_BRUPA|nr:unnamed protein product [Brugia pahangi]
MEFLTFTLADSGWNPMPYCNALPDFNAAGLRVSAKVRITSRMFRESVENEGFICGKEALANDPKGPHRFGGTFWMEDEGQCRIWFCRQGGIARKGMQDKGSQRIFIHNRVNDMRRSSKVMLRLIIDTAKLS